MRKVLDHPSSSSASSSSSAAIPVLDKLCSGLTDREVFRNEYKDDISSRQTALRSQRVQQGGSLNSAGIYQTAAKEVWEALPDTKKQFFKDKAKALNSDVLQ